MKKIEWNIYTATDAEVTALWRLVQETLSSTHVAEPRAKKIAAEVKVA